MLLASNRRIHATPDLASHADLPLPRSLVFFVDEFGSDGDVVRA
jgi:hypothetical protein